MQNIEISRFNSPSIFSPVLLDTSLNYLILGVIFKVSSSLFEETIGKVLEPYFNRTVIDLMGIVVGYVAISGTALPGSAIIPFHLAGFFTALKIMSYSEKSSHFNQPETISTEEKKILDAPSKNLHTHSFELNQMNEVDPIVAKFLEENELESLINEEKQSLDEVDPIDPIVIESLNENEVNPIVTKFLEENEIELLVDQEKGKPLPFYHLKSVLALIALSSKTTLPELEVVEERLEELKIQQHRISPAIANVSTRIFQTSFFEVDQALRLPSERRISNIRFILGFNRIQDVFINGGHLVGLASEQEREQLFYQVKHVIYGLRCALDKNLDSATKQTYASYLESFMDQTAECKDGWESALKQFDPVLSEYCRCESCTQGREKEDGQDLLDKALKNKITHFKQESFQFYVIKTCKKDDARNPNDGQNPHTINWYASRLPELGISTLSNDAYPGCAVNQIPVENIKAGFLAKYEKELCDYVKGLFSFTTGEREIRELFMDTLKGWIQQEARRASIEVPEDGLAELINHIIFDESYEARGPLVVSLLRALGHMGGSPLSPEEEFLSSKFNV